MPYTISRECRADGEPFTVNPKRLLQEMRKIMVKRRDPKGYGRGCYTRIMGLIGVDLFHIQFMLLPE